MTDQETQNYQKRPVPGQVLPNGMVAPLSAVPSAAQPYPSASTATASSTTPPLTPSPKKNNRKLFAVLGMVVFLIVAAMGVYISLLQRVDDSSLAPTAPESRPSANITPPANNCTLSFDVPVETTPTATPSATPTATPSATPTPTPTPTTYRCNSLCTTDANCQTVNSNYVCTPVGSESRCRLSTNLTSDSCQILITTTPTVGCNNTCINNSDCANPDHICFNNRCRLATSPESASCTIVTVQPTPPPILGCGAVCNSNSDCANSSHICYNNTCRLGENPTNQYCVLETEMPRTITTTAPSSPTTAMPQPELPAELPQSGPQDWANWLRVGVGVVVVGAVLMLFL